MDPLTAQNDQDNLQAAQPNPLPAQQDPATSAPEPVQEPAPAHMARPSGVESIAVTQPEQQSAPQETVVVQEAGIEAETLPSTETQQAPENLPAPETIQPEVPQQTNQPIQPAQQPVDTTPVEEPQNVVDMRTGEHAGKNVSENADEITSIADLEEQEFIEEVEKQHADQ